MMTLEFVEASTGGQYELFRQLMQRYARIDLADPQNSSVWKDIDNLPGRYAPPQGCVWLASVDSALAGCGGMAPTANAGQAEMKRMYVLPDYRGRGVGRALAQTVMAKACDAGYHQLVLSTWNHNTSALGLYGQLGFAPIPPFKQHSSANLIFLGHAL